MPHGAAFLTLTEYHAGNGLEPGRGLFKSRKLPLPRFGDATWHVTALVRKR